MKSWLVWIAAVSILGCEPRIETLERTAEGGDAGAQLALGLIYMAGDQLDANPALGVEWIRRSALQGNPEAESALGFAYERGEGVELDPTAAREWQERAAEHGLVTAQAALGRYYLERIGGDAKPHAAMAWLRQAAEAGDPDAQALLGATFRWGWGRKVIRANPELAEKWLRAAAAQGRSKDQYKLARLYFDKKLYEQARIPLDKAVAQDLPEAYVLLARMHREGLGVPTDPAESVKLLRVSIGFGDPASRNDLGEALAQGIGVAKDVEAAFALFETAAMQGDVEAQYNLALAYLDGTGVERDKLTGHAWLRICTSQTFREAIKERGRRRGDLSAEERQRVRRLESELAAQLPPFETIASSRIQF